MILIENRRWLNKYHRHLVGTLKEVTKISADDVIVEESKEGLPTLKVKLDGKYQYLHSKYKPSQDAKRILRNIKDEDTTPILFWGIGLGYHIDEFVKKYPNRKFSIYEPDENVFYQFMKYSNISLYRPLNVLSIHVGLDKYEKKMDKILTQSKGKMHIIALPAYERNYTSYLTELEFILIDSMKNKRQGLQAELGFQQRWTLNSVKNFLTVIETPNFLDNEVLQNTEGKTAILVSAGPSLNYEYDNLRHIIDNDLAYVFAVGSAINSLVEERITPHAFMSYDPKEKNQIVVKKIKDKGIEDVPIVFGSSIGYETIEDYPGKKYHFFTNQDHISSYLISDNLPTVNDAPSIAVVTLQLLLKMNFKKIVFVGQNLAFSGEYRHAEGIDYEGYNAKITKEEEKEIIYIKDVDGNEIKTKEGFESMRQQLEMYIEAAIAIHDEIQFMNTTKGGARIRNTIYKPLEELIDESYFNKVPTDNLFPTENNYNITEIQQQVGETARDARKVKRTVNQSFEALKKIQKAMELRRVNQLENIFGEFDKVFSNIEENKFYQAFIKSMLRVQFDQLAETVDQIKYETDVLKKAEVIIVSFNTYLNYILEGYSFIKPHFEKMVEEIRVVNKYEN